MYRGDEMLIQLLMVDGDNNFYCTEKKNLKDQHSYNYYFPPQISYLFSTMDVTHKWLPIHYSFVLAQISLASLVSIQVLN